MGAELFKFAAIFLLFLIIVLLIFREIVCWYWKINHSVALLTEIRDLLRNSIPATNLLHSSSLDANLPELDVAAVTEQDLKKIETLRDRAFPVIQKIEKFGYSFTGDDLSPSKTVWRFFSTTANSKFEFDSFKEMSDFADRLKV